MNGNSKNEYVVVRGNGLGFYEEQRGLIEVSGTEAVMFLNGLITNDAKKLEENKWMLAAFPNAQGRLLALVRVLRVGDKFLFDTDPQTYGKVLQNLSRFTMAGDFKVNDLTESFSCVSVRGEAVQSLRLKVQSFDFAAGENEIAISEINSKSIYAIRAFRAVGFDVFLPKSQAANFIDELKNSGAVELSEETIEVLRVENGEPKYAVDMDETTVVLETGLDEAVSFNKGCYIGQEIIARIHFRGHVAKKLSGLILENEANVGDELKSVDGKNAGKITSVTFSPTLAKNIALAFVRYDYLADGTALKIGDSTATVKNLPFII